MALFGGGNQNQNSLMPNGVGSGPTQAQAQLFAQAAQDSGLAQMGLNMVDNATNGMKNEDQVQLLYQLMAAHPNQVSLFFLHYPQFLTELTNTIALVVRKEMFALLNSDMIPALKVSKDHADFASYSSITQENIDAQLAKVVPMQQLQMEVQQNDMQAMNLMNGHQQQMMMGNMQQQMMQQQMYQQQMMGMQQPQRPGIGAALGGFGSSLLRGTLGLPPAQQPQMGYGQMPPGQYPPQQ
jgi:hypothetical protein